MRLLSLRAAKIFSLAARTTELDLDRRGLVLITGHSFDEGSANGSGKSTVANKSIIWTLFGQTAGGTKGDAVVNRHLGGTAWGEVIFEDDHDEYKILRQRNPAALLLHKFNPLKQEWDDLSRRSQSDTQSLIDTALGRDLNTFLQTDFFGQGRADSFLSLTPSQQVEVLEDILPIENLTQWAAFAKDSKKSLKGPIHELERNARVGAGRTSELEDVITRLAKDANEFDRQAGEDKAMLLKKIELIDAANVITQARMEEIVERLSEIKPSVSGSRDKEITLLKEIEEAKANHRMCREGENDLMLQHKEAEAGLMGLEKDTCPTCEQAISKEISQNLFITQHEIRGKLSELDGHLEITRSHVQGWKKQLEALHEKLVAVQMASAQELEKARLGEEYSTLYAVRQQERKNMLLDKLAELKKPNPYWKQIEEHRERVTVLRLEEHELSSSIAKLNREEYYLSYWATTFGKDFKTYLFNKACPYLQARTAYHLKGLGNDQLKVEFSTTKELKSGEERSGFSVVVYSDSGGKGFDSLSGGEQQMASFAVGLALADLSETQVQGASHFLILDEPFMALDERNCENLVNYLANELSSKRETILLISNEENLKSLIPNRVHVEKTGGVTSVRD